MIDFYKNHDDLCISKEKYKIHLMSYGTFFSKIPSPLFNS